MADILQDLPIKADADRVFDAISTPDGLNRWWTQYSAGKPIEGAEYELWFGPEHEWRARVIRAESPSRFELELVAADEDWIGTRVGFELESKDDGSTLLRFHHTGWPRANEHYRISCHCWAMYLRVLRRYLEHNEIVPYEERLDV